MLLVIRVPIAWAIGTARFSAWPVALVLVGLVVPWLFIAEGLSYSSPPGIRRPFFGAGPLAAVSTACNGFEGAWR